MTPGTFTGNLGLPQLTILYSTPLPPYYNIGQILNVAMVSIFLACNIFSDGSQGHTIVPGVIPTGTLLYHGRDDPVIPSHPDWIAMFPEFSLRFCGDSEDPTGNGCWLLTTMTTRPLKILYFDGSSAAKMEGGTLDSQDILQWGEVRPGYTVEDFQRIMDLCEWGQPLGLDGFVRCDSPARFCFILTYKCRMSVGM